MNGTTIYRLNNNNFIKDTFRIVLFSLARQIPRMEKICKLSTFYRREKEIF